jgi:hypothetical protein
VLIQASEHYCTLEHKQDLSDIYADDMTDILPK